MNLKDLCYCFNCGAVLVTDYVLHWSDEEFDTYISGCPACGIKFTDQNDVGKFEEEDE